MYQPLADLLRPQTLDEVYGQEHILGKGAVLRRLIDSGNIPNMCPDQCYFAALFQSDWRTSYSIAG